MKLTRVRYANQNLNELVQRSLRLKSQVAPAVLKNVNVGKDALYIKIQDLNKWYTRVIGLDEVRLYQDRVVSLQERLLAAQEKRREISQQLADIRRKSNDLQDQIHKVKRQENLQRFLELMREETEILKMEEEASRTFSEWDREEREIFTAFTNAVRDSHEKQRAQVEYTKYFGIILSIVGSLLTFCYSTVKKHDLKRCIEENIAKLGTLPHPMLIDSMKSVIQQPSGSGFNPNDNIDISKLILNSSAPILKEFKSNKKELEEIRKLLQGRNLILPVLKQLESSEQKLNDIKRLLVNGDYAVSFASSNSDNRRITDFERAEVESNTRQLVFYGVVLIGVVVVLRGFFG